MNVAYHMVKIDGHETLCVGGHIVADDENPGMLWITSVQGEKLLHVHHSDYRAITREEAEAQLAAAHARRQAEGSGPLEVAVVSLTQAKETVEKQTPGFKQFPAWPEPPRNIFNN